MKVVGFRVNFRLILFENRADVFFVRTSVRYFLIKIKGCEPLMSDPSGSTQGKQCTEKMTTEYY